MKTCVVRLNHFLQPTEGATKFIEAPAIQVAAKAAAAGGNTFSAVGREIGPYRVKVSLGLGGMGEVYRAVDTRLDRSVALKLLPSEFTRYEAERIRRFEREARAASALKSSEHRYHLRDRAERRYLLHCD